VVGELLGALAEFLAQTVNPFARGARREGKRGESGISFDGSHDRPRDEEGEPP
jgi:hypothetical protein